MIEGARGETMIGEKRSSERIESLKVKKKDNETG